jgi:hypothetical protein
MHNGHPSAIQFEELDLHVELAGVLHAAASLVLAAFALAPSRS